VDFTEFVTIRQRVLLRFAMALSGDACEAEEIVADVLARAYERWDRISRFEQVNGYVRRMVINE
jgi:DNA-directed RNA polymerase specialized sigma24 family protein